MGKSKRRHRIRAQPGSRIALERVQALLPAPLVPPPPPSPQQVKNFDFGDTQLPDEYNRIINCKINNITNIRPSKAVSKIISLGGKHRFLPNDASNGDIIKNFDAFARSTKCIEKFTDEPERKDGRFSVSRPSYDVGDGSMFVETYLKNLRIDLYDQLSSIPIIKKPRRTSWHEKILATIKSMCTHYEAMITNTDKNLGLILLYRRQYNRMCFDHLGDPLCYKLLPLHYERQHNYPNPTHKLHAYNDTTSTFASYIISEIFTSFKQSLHKYDKLFNHDKEGYETKQQRTNKLNNSLFFTENNDGVIRRHKRTTPTLLLWDSLSMIAKFTLQLEYTIDLVRISLFYILPKVHKDHETVDDIKGRPIVSSINSPTYYPSKYIDIILQELVKRLATNLKNTNTLLLLLYGVKFNPNVWFLTADVTALYPSINIVDGLIMIRKMLTDNLDKGIPNLTTPADVEHIIDFMNKVLTQNYVEFGDRMFLQTQGTAMGTPLAVVFANIYMTGLHLQCLETCNTLKTVNPFTHVLPPLHSSEYKNQLEFDFDKVNLCFTLSAKSKLDYPDIDLSPGNAGQPYSDYLINERFIDDIFSIWPNQFAPLIYITVFNTLNKTIKLTYDISFDFGIMMDVKIFKGTNFKDDTGLLPDIITGTLDTELYQKPTNLFLHLPYQSYHDSYENIAMAERKRTCLLCSDYDTFIRFDGQYKIQLFNRGYPADLLDKWFSIPLDREILIRTLLTKRNNPSTNQRKNLLIYKMLRCTRNLDIKFSNLFRLPKSLKRKRNGQNIHIFPHKITVCKTSGRNLKSYLCSARCKDKFTDAQIKQI